VVRNTVTSLLASPDRSPIAEDVIWSEDEPGVFLSSHRLMSYATSIGPDGLFGTISGARVPILVIADCLCRDNEIIKEWIARDYVQLVRSLGLEPRSMAEQLAERDKAGDPVRHEWRAREMARLRSAREQFPPRDHPAAALAIALDSAFNQDLYGEASDIVSPSIEVRWPSGRNLCGRGAWIGCLIQLRGNLSDQRWALEHWAARPLPDGDIAVALRWWLTGRHTSMGAWGPPSGKELLVLGISHYRLRAGRVIEDTTVFDELGVLRQIAGGLGS
jgi:hypothetical protein